MDNLYQKLLNSAGKINFKTIYKLNEDIVSSIWKHIAAVSYTFAKTKRASSVRGRRVATYVEDNEKQDN